MESVSHDSPSHSHTTARVWVTGPPSHKYRSPLTGRRLSPDEVGRVAPRSLAGGVLGRHAELVLGAVDQVHHPEGVTEAAR